MLAVSVLLALIHVLGMVAMSYLCGRKAGEKRGRDAQWVDDYFMEQDRLKQLRGLDGRFKKKT